MIIKLTVRILLISLLVVFSAGILMIPTAAEEVSEEPSEVPLEQLETPNELMDLVDMFSRLEYKILQTSEGEVLQDTRINYSYEGIEEIEGTEANVLYFSGTEGIESMLLWINDEGAVLQAEIDEEPLPVEFIEMMGEQLFQSVLFPFYYFDQFALEELEHEALTSVNRTSGQIGDLEVDIIEIELGTMEEYELESMDITLAEHEDFLMLQKYKMLTINGDELLLEIDFVELR